eukprot:TRINITY_DN16640_c0_g1_i3.p1 TRINITY_DN16640_c0_g1~~TRINITY_DN16640_c0_g1_i3.p1  ORF type:complete len:363 (-),score=126.61 TRINITY_DN16640_c0_g1_i3:74-1162(-)
MHGGEGLDPALAAELGGVEDPELAAAIEASYRSQAAAQQVPAGVAEDEDQDLARVLELSRLEALREEERREKGEAPASMDVDKGDAFPSFASGSSAAAGSSSNAAPPPAVMPDLGNGRIRLAPAHARSEAGDSADAVDWGGSPRGSPREHGLGMTDEVMDAQMAAALEASYAAQTEAGRHMNEEDMIREALEISRMEEERRQNASLREEQEAELQESLLMDQMREQEEKRRRLEEEEERKAKEASQLAEEQRQADEEKARADQQAAKAARVPAEPSEDEPNKVDLQIRLPDGRRVRRRFLSSHLVGQVYDYIDVEGLTSECEVEAYFLVSTMPRKEYKDREKTLAEVGLQGQCALIVEREQA